ncbi:MULTISPECIES: sulfate ABC transporter permease subunit CysT [Dyella]|uniref:Sulfate transport system permease protein CysT n=2 Tax=Dyella TaxID=231454 RepID=A0A4R0YU25_9GAMM|nr:MULTISPECIES: sulfate ABC transporter permease subunit CysT [Dyella]TBR39511.1 sulfate ABC transporter permease subunit CysT [Dyella terrae]TCI12903.1 sulfate ABC transporter permease subunit CysT [Dyella soli]
MNRRHTLPGFGLSLGVTISWLSLIVLLPLAALAFRVAEQPWDAWWGLLRQRRVLLALQLSFGGAVLAAFIDVVLGMLLAWVLVRYRFPWRRLCDALIDLPFALPTAVAGIALTALYVPDGWLGRWLAVLGVQVAYTRLGVLMAMVFVGLPFAVRTLQPVLESLEADVEEAAWTLGASRWQRFHRVVLPVLTPALLTGFAMALARAVGEYGSVIFISGNLPMRTEIVPLLIVQKIDGGGDIAPAAMLGACMLLLSLLALLSVHGLQRWSGRWREVR